MPSELERIREWANFYRVSSPGYQTNALIAVLKNDGEKILMGVLKELNLTQTIDFVRETASR